MSAPRTKRPFAGASADPSQRQITSFFPRAADDAAQPAPRQPLLPSSVQANLLSVGMRVRKSVPEGYKTTGTSAFKLWTDNTAVAPRAAAMRAASRELLPFCGINKVGGLDAQPPCPDDQEEGVQPVPGLDDVPGLTMSQESVDSNAPEPSRKRVHVENEPDDSPTMLAAPGKGWDEQVSPRSLGPAQWCGSRVMAVPRARARRPGSKDVDQENMATGEDFGEADFFVFKEGRDTEPSWQ
ncbi:uncharacterized protein UV8b_01874 [Ustilaginoidea virens]|uniref:Uncharacterized protein n=1 Tax=Ustilaginoidea virens TaxID=1159556 RepID=A0A063BVB5_USTVR|nr:uncharacterized protein UV8b_01874 [Ustilaginoidea virens]QUC17633.1 hypothetical protein UV8b_01874 [Ustilaginoidea virens]GAO14038.1 hypothetical protein UVI_02035870 [Ustilaginoidea virens]